MFILILLPLLLLPHTTANTPQQLYLEQLLHRLHHMQLLIKDVQNITSNLNLNLQLANTPDTETRLRIAALEDEHSLALQLWSDLFLPINLKTWSCPALPSSESKASLDKTINQIAFFSFQISKTMDQQPYCYRNQRIKLQNEFVNRTMVGLKKEMVQYCDGRVEGKEHVPFLMTEQTRNVPNLNTTIAWTYGNITQTQYQNKVQQLKSVFGATPCPVNLPFLGTNNQCFRCNQEGSVYDVSAKECRECLEGCSIDGGKLNSQASADNYMGNRPNDIEALSCPKAQPFFNGHHCISCNLPLFFNFDSHSCQSCPTDTGFDLKLKQCVSNVFFLSFAGQLDNYIGGPYSPPQFSTLKKCTKEQPYSNGNVCIACLLPHFYNYHTGACQSCPNGLQFSTVSRGCVGGRGTKSNNNLLGDRNFIGAMPAFDRLYAVCPTDKRFFNGVQCIGCQLPQHFNFQSMKCQNCLGGHRFDVKVGDCVADTQTHFTNSNAKNIYLNGDFQTFKQECQSNRAKGLQECPITTPFYDPRSNSCGQCPSNSPLFDVKRGKCMSCPWGSTYKEAVRICISSQVALSVERMIMNAI